MKTLLFIYLQLLLLLLIIIGRVVQVEYLHLVVEVEPSTITELCLSDGIDGYLGSFYLNTTFAELMLKEHNNKRKLHQSCPLKWSSELFNYASQFAAEYSCSGILQHSGGKYGENLAFGYLPIGAIEAWYDEGEMYVYGSENVYNHFTAIVWNNTNSLGCAYKSCDTTTNLNALYIVCSYYPPGNVIGYSSQNVFPLNSKMVN